MRPVWKQPMEQQMHTADVKALVGALPMFKRRVKLRIVCGDKGCGRVWERRVTMGDPQAQHAFEDTLREARLHCTLADHAAGNLTVESL
jgi:hypothetical protein